MKKEQIVTMVQKHHSLLTVLAKGYNRINPKNRFRHTSSCSLSCGVSFFHGLKIDNRGKHNSIQIGDFCRLKNSSILLHGDHNRVILGDFVCMNGVELYMEDDGNRIQIGEHCNFCGSAEFAAIEGTGITIGRDCLFSGNLQFRTGDSHSILDLKGNRINPSQDIIIGDHVWVGNQVTCLKGTRIADHCVVGSTSTLCRHYDKPNSIIAGVPGKIVKTDIDWCTPRISVK